MSAKKISSGTSAATVPDTLLVPEKIAPLVVYLRHEKVIVDADLAELYGVTTGNLNKAVGRNLDEHDQHFQLVFEAIKQLISADVAAKAKPAREIGFHVP
jgi:hypothetical protein